MSDYKNPAELDDLTAYASSPVEEIADALFVWGVREAGLGDQLDVTQEMPAVPMAELVAASTYKREGLVNRAWRRAVNHLVDEGTLVARLRAGDNTRTLTEVEAICDEEPS
jgi:hypothetical protein